MEFDQIAVRTLRRILRRLGEDVEYLQDGAEPVPVRGLFEEQHQEIDPNTGVPFYSLNPVLTVVAEDLPEGSPRPNDRVIRRGRSYRVVGDRPDSGGGTLLELKT